MTRAAEAGKVGGRGVVKAVGRFGKGRERFNVTSGTGDFDGAAAAAEQKPAA